MAHFAHIGEGDAVCSVIVIEQAVIDASGGWPCPNCHQTVAPAGWVQTSYNTSEGVHKLGGTPLRKNYAGIGFTYDRTRDAFIPPKKFDSWVLDEEKCVYVAPKEKPEDGTNYYWNESKEDWDVLSISVLDTPE